MKKRGATKLHWDASYKEPKHLAKYHGEPVFHALITATNEVLLAQCMRGLFLLCVWARTTVRACVCPDAMRRAQFGEIRLQFHVVTDGHDQMRASIKAFLETMNAYGQPDVDMLTTDNPYNDKPFFHEVIPSLKKAEVRFNTDMPCQARGPAVSVLDATRYQTLNQTQAINAKITAVRSQMGALPRGDQVVGLDAEWDTFKSKDGMVRGRGTVAVIQLSYRLTSDAEVKCLVLQVHGRKTLPQTLLDWFADRHVTWTGRNVGGDIAHIGKDFNCRKIADRMRRDSVCELGDMARRRDAVPKGSASLQTLVEVVLNETMDKSPTLRLCEWSSKILTTQQQEYAALDAIKSLEVYFQLIKRPDLSTRLAPSDVQEDVAVDVVPGHGCVSVMATRGAIGTVQAQAPWKPPADMSPALLKPTPARCLVKVTTVLAPGLVVPGMKKHGSAVTLGDFGAPPFCVMLPLKMLKQHVASDNIRVFGNNGAAPAQGAAGGEGAVGDEGGADVVGAGGLGGGAQAGAGGGDSHQGAGGAGAQGAHVSGARGSQNGARSGGGHGQASHGGGAVPASQGGDDSDGGMDEDEQDVDAMTAGPNDDGAADLHVPSEQDVAMLLASRQAAAAAQWSQELEKLLGKAPPRIRDEYSSVIGDGFHFMDRPKVPVHHECKKPYFHALQEAWFAWDPEKLQEVTDALKADGLSEDDIEAKMYYDADYFRARVPRVVLPPSKLYPRVRAVFEVYGPKVDSESKKPLFNKTAWAKAAQVLREIVLGLASDPPGVQFYTVKLDAKGQPMLDQYGIALIDCSRGTNDTECVHKQIVTTFGSWNTGVELGDMLMAERRHRYNHKVSERRRLGFPRIGHFDTWLIDSVQVLVEKNHGVLLFPEWSNASDYKTTPESFGTVCMHSDALQDAMNKIKLDTEPELCEELRYLCSAMGTKLPLLPVSGNKEQQTFAALIHDAEYPFDYEQMAIDWCEKVDGIDVWPKLPVYLRTYHRRFLRNQRVKDAVIKAKEQAAELKTLNQQTSQGLVSDTLSASLPDVMPAALSGARREEPVCFVGGSAVGGAPATIGVKRLHGQRGQDKAPRKTRSCSHCLKTLKRSAEDARACPGKHWKVTCPYKGGGGGGPAVAGGAATRRQDGAGGGAGSSGWGAR